MRLKRDLCIFIVISWFVFVATQTFALPKEDDFDLEYIEPEQIKTPPTVRLLFTKIPGFAYGLQGKQGPEDNWQDSLKVPIDKDGLTFFELPIELVAAPRAYRIYKIPERERARYFDYLRITGQAYGNTASMMVVPGN